jgi:hypothetical protein
MNIGRVLEFAWTLCVWFFLVFWLVVPIALAYWRHNERLRAEQTEKTLDSLGFDTSHQYEQDAMN